MSHTLLNGMADQISHLHAMSATWVAESGLMMSTGRPGGTTMKVRHSAPSARSASLALLELLEWQPQFSLTCKAYSCTLGECWGSRQN